MTFPARRVIVVLALAVASLSACLPDVPTPTPALPSRAVAPVPAKVVQSVPAPPAGPIPNATPANPGPAEGYPAPPDGPTPTARPIIEPYLAPGANPKP